PATLQLARNRPHALGAQRLVRRGQIDQIAVMRDHGPDPARGERRAKRRDVGVAYHWLAPLVRRLREDLNRGRPDGIPPRGAQGYAALGRSEEHTSELQSRGHLVCRLLLEKKKKIKKVKIM